MTRLLWLATGWLSLGLAILGALLPLLPTTPFLLAAAYSFSQSSPRFHRWLLSHPRFGQPIRHWQREGAISRKGKAAACLAMLATLTLTLALGASWTIVAVQIVVLGLVALFVLSRPTPTSDA